MCGFSGHETVSRRDAFFCERRTFRDHACTMSALGVLAAGFYGGAQSEECGRVAGDVDIIARMHKAVELLETAAA